ncbi:MAG: sulfur carrier protein ThiS [Planctomycetota bacterium]
MDPDLKQAQTVQINGQSRAWRPNWSLLDLLTELEATGPGVAVERNRAVVPKAQHGDCQLEPGDIVEVVRLVGGG